MCKIQLPPFSGNLEAKAARREAAIVAVLQLLAEEQMTTPALAEALGLHKSTMFIYLRHMSKDRQLVRKTGKFEALTNAAYWELGSELDRYHGEEKEDPKHAPKRKIVQARQIGIPRDPLIEAFFGPANQEHKEAA